MPVSASSMPSIEFLRTKLDYDPHTGVFRWKENQKSSVKAGAVAGTHHSCGYTVIGVGGQRYLAHRLAWFMFYGELGEFDQIDHVNLNRKDNRIENLRLASHAENCRNTGCRTHSTSGLKGAHYDKRQKRYKSRITFGGKKIWIGAFGTAEEAHEAYCKKAEELYGKFFRRAAR